MNRIINKTVENLAMGTKKETPESVSNSLVFNREACVTLFQATPSATDGLALRVGGGAVADFVGGAVIRQENVNCTLLRVPTFGKDVSVVGRSTHQRRVLNAVGRGAHLDGIGLFRSVGVGAHGAFQQGGGHVTLDVLVVLGAELRGDELGLQDADDAVDGGRAVAQQIEAFLAGGGIAGIELNGHGDHGSCALDRLAQETVVDGFKLGIARRDVGEGHRGRGRAVFVAVEVDVAIHRVGVRAIGQCVARYLGTGLGLTDQRMPLVFGLHELLKTARVDGQVVEVDAVGATGHAEGEAEAENRKGQAFAKCVEAFFHDVVFLGSLVQK